MQKIESKHINQRTRIKRLARRTICFSKTIQMHDIVIGLFINRYEARGSDLMLYQQVENTSHEPLRPLLRRNRASYYLCLILGNQLPRGNLQVPSRLPKEVLFAKFYTAVPENVICCCDMEINIW
jgi:hypothetical protein